LYTLVLLPILSFYTNTLAKLREELRRKRKRPGTVYFSPSSDPFQPVPDHAGNSRVRALPASARLEIMDRLKSIACRYGMKVLVCACKNPDISSGSCHISGRWPAEVREGSQLGLFGS
jgi:hypothetical protein